MAKNLIVIGTAVALVFAVAFVATDGGSAIACDKNKKDTAASASAASVKEAGSAKTASACCAKTTASAATVASTQAAGANGCARTASQAECAEVAAAKVASAGCCAGKSAAAAAAVAAGSSCSSKASYAVAGVGCSATSAGAVACRDQARADVAGYSKSGDERAEDAKAHTENLKSFVDEVPYMAPRRVVVQGSMACGHCTYEKTAGCAPLIKTTDGKVYPLLPGQLVDKMKHTSAPNGLRVTTNVQKVDGIRYLHVKSFEAL